MGNVQYKNDKVWEVTEGLIIFDVPANGLGSFSLHSRAFRKFFPNLYADYQRQALKGLVPGDTLYYETDTQRILLVCNRWADHGINCTDRHYIINKTILAMEEIGQHSLEKEKIYSGILGVKDSWSSIASHIKHKTELDWIVCTQVKLKD